MAAEDYWDGRDPWEEDDEPRFYPRRSTPRHQRNVAAFKTRSTCSFCNTSGLKWKQHEGKWRLVSQVDESLHICREGRQ